MKRRPKNCNPFGLHGISIGHLLEIHQTKIKKQQSNLNLNLINIQHRRKNKVCLPTTASTRFSPLSRLSLTLYLSLSPPLSPSLPPFHGWATAVGCPRRRRSTASGRRRVDSAGSASSRIRRRRREQRRGGGQFGARAGSEAAAAAEREIGRDRGVSLRRAAAARAEDVAVPQGPVSGS